MKKSQMEILGLVFIVIIVIMGMFFMISSSLKKEDSVKSSYLSTEISQNLLNSMFKANAISSLTIADCVIDIRETDNKCGSSSLDYSRDALKKMLEETLGKWGRSYRLTITDATVNGNNIKSVDNEEFKPIPEDSDCGPNDEKEAPGFRFLPSSEGTIVIQLDVCKG